LQSGFRCQPRRRRSRINQTRNFGLALLFQVFYYEANQKRQQLRSKNHWSGYAPLSAWPRAAHNH
jgi:hypothetical protein